MHKRAQGWGFDLMVAMAIFLGGVIFFYFYVINEPGGERESYAVLEGEGQVISESLMSSGFPENWTASDVVRIGIVDDDKVNQTKLDVFYSMVQSDYNETRRLFNILNDYYIVFSGNVSIGGSDVEVIGLEGTDFDNLAKVSRLVVYNNSVRTMEVFVWD